MQAIFTFTLLTETHCQPCSCPALTVIYTAVAHFLSIILPSSKQKLSMKKHGKTFCCRIFTRLKFCCLFFPCIHCFSVFSLNECSLFTHGTVIQNNWMFCLLSFPFCPHSPILKSPLCPNSLLHLLLPLHQRCLQTPLPILSSSSSLHPSRHLPSSPAPQSHPGSTFLGLAQSQGPQLLLLQLQLRRPRLGAVGPSQQPACGPRTRYEASPTRCYPHPWAPLIPRCTPP